MNKYERLKSDLEQHGIGVMKSYGNSMLPILSNPSTNTFKRQPSYEVGDIVFRKVRGRYIDAHLIAQVSSDGRCMISNNRGHENGWASFVYGRVIKSVDKNGIEKEF